MWNFINYGDGFDLGESCAGKMVTFHDVIFPLALPFESIPHLFQPGANNMVTRHVLSPGRARVNFIEMGCEINKSGGNWGWS